MTIADRTSPVQPVQGDALDLSARFPNVVAAETRPSYTGWIVPKENLIEVATALRDEFSFDLLSSVTGVDYLGYPDKKRNERFNVVYHMYSIDHGHRVRVKVPLQRGPGGPTEARAPAHATPAPVPSSRSRRLHSPMPADLGNRVLSGLLARPLSSTRTAVPPIQRRCACGGHGHADSPCADTNIRGPIIAPRAMSSSMISNAGDSRSSSTSSGTPRPKTSRTRRSSPRSRCSTRTSGRSRARWVRTATTRASSSTWRRRS